MAEWMSVLRYDAVAPTSLTIIYETGRLYDTARNVLVRWFVILHEMESQRTRAVIFQHGDETYELRHDIM